MPQDRERHRDARDLGSRSPASEEAKEQNASGQRGGPRQGGPRPAVPDQVAQTSGRRSAQHESRPEERSGFAPGQAPSEQGEKDHPSPEMIARGQQGLRGQSPAHGAHRERSEEDEQHGEPRGEHTRGARQGRQRLPGDRPRG